MRISFKTISLLLLTLLISLAVCATAEEGVTRYEKDFIKVRYEHSGAVVVDEIAQLKVGNTEASAGYRTFSRLEGPGERLTVKKAIVRFPDDTEHTYDVSRAPLIEGNPLYRGLRRVTLSVEELPVGSEVFFHLVKYYPSGHDFAMSSFVETDQINPNLEFVVEYPKNRRDIQTKAQGDFPYSLAKNTRGGMRVLSYRAKNDKPKYTEPFSPGGKWALGQIYVSNYDSWESIAELIFGEWVREVASVESLEEESADGGGDSLSQLEEALKSLSSSKIVVPLIGVYREGHSPQAISKERFISDLDAAILVGSMAKSLGLQVEPVVFLKASAEQVATSLPDPELAENLFLVIRDREQVAYWRPEALGQLSHFVPSDLAGGSWIRYAEELAIESAPNSTFTESAVKTEIEALLRQEDATIAMVVKELRKGLSGAKLEELGDLLAETSRSKRDQSTRVFFKALASEISPKTRVVEYLFPYGSKNQWWGQFESSDILSADEEGEIKIKVDLPLPVKGDLLELLTSEVARRSDATIPESGTWTQKMHFIIPSATAFEQIPADFEKESDLYYAKRFTKVEDTDCFTFYQLKLKKSEYTANDINRMRRELKSFIQPEANAYYLIPKKD